MSRGLLFLLIVILLAGFAATGVNTVPRLEEKVNASWAEVQNQYQRRLDLVPNLVATVKGYASFEKDTLTAVIDARASATRVNVTPETLNDPEKLRQYEAAQAHLGSALSRLLVVSERYPDLKANQQFIALQSQLEGTENRIAVARRDYIETVQEYDTTIRTFPGLIWARLYGAQPKPEFAADAGAQAAPQVKF
jgi:LemA protein